MSRMVNISAEELTALMNENARQKEHIQILQSELSKFSEAVIKERIRRDSFLMANKFLHEVLKRLGLTNKATKPRFPEYFTMNTHIIPDNWKNSESSRIDIKVEPECHIEGKIKELWFRITLLNP